MSEQRKAAPAKEAESDRIYPCCKCGKLRTKAEGGTVFTVCEKCWDEPWGTPAQEPTTAAGQEPSEAEALREVLREQWSILASDMDRLKEILDDHWELRTYYVDAVAALKARLVAAEAENERLRREVAEASSGGER